MESPGITFELEKQKRHLLLKNLPEQGLDSLSIRDAKNQLIGSQDIKEKFFEMGILECLMPLIQKESNLLKTSEDQELLLNIVGIINSYFFDFEKALRVLEVYKEVFLQLLESLQEVNRTFEKKNFRTTQLIESLLRVTKNAITSKILSAEDLKEVNIIACFENCMTSKYRVSLVG